MKKLQKKHNNGFTLLEAIIESRGYNTCNLSAPSVVERGIRVFKY